MGKAGIRPLTTKQRKWADRKLITGNGSQAAHEVYNVSTDESARAIASQNLTKPNVKAYLESKAERASQIVFDIAENGENDGVRLNASKDILDRAGYKPVDKSVSVTLEGQISKEERDKILGISSKVRDELTQNEING